MIVENHVSAQLIQLPRQKFQTWLLHLQMDWLQSVCISINLNSDEKEIKTRIP